MYDIKGNLLYHYENLTLAAKALKVSRVSIQRTILKPNNWCTRGNYFIWLAWLPGQPDHTETQTVLPSLDDCTRGVLQYDLIAKYPSYSVCLAALNLRSGNLSRILYYLSGLSQQGNILK